MRLRFTALPSFFVTVKPARGSPPSPRSRIWITTPLAAKELPLAAARKSARLVIRPTAKDQAERRLRPRARRRAMTLRPPVVAMRERKPCRRLRTSFEG